MDIVSFFRKPQAPAPAQPASPIGQIGVTGLKIASGYIWEEFVPELQGDRGRKTYREMSDNDDVIGAVLYGIERLVQAVEWKASPSEADTTGQYADFTDECFSDMDQPLSEFLAEVLTQNTFGFSVFETVYKRRSGMDPAPGMARSNFSDGRIGFHKLAPRAQESIDRWERAPNGDILGFYQQDPNGAPNIYIPIEKAVLFRTTSRKDNPEGRSLLRNCYRPWYFKKNIEWTEAIGIERDLAGLPVVRIPSNIIADPANASALAEYKKMARDMKFNEQGGVVIPSDLWPNENGTLSSTPMVDVTLITSGGTRAINTNDTIMRYNRAIATTFLADFIMLGSTDAGSFALSKSKTQLFIKAVEGIVKGIADTLNRDLMPKLWKINGFDPIFMPIFTPGQIAPQDLVELGDYVSKLASAGMVFGGDIETEKVLRQAADLPEEVQPEDIMAYRETMTPPELQQDNQDDPNGTKPKPPGRPGGE